MASHPESHPHPDSSGAQAASNPPSTSATMTPPIRRKPVGASASSASVNIPPPQPLGADTAYNPNPSSSLIDEYSTLGAAPAPYNPPVSSGLKTEILPSSPPPPSPQQAEEGGKSRSWFPFIKHRTASERVSANLAKQFTGRRGLKRTTIVHRPTLQEEAFQDPEQGINLADGKGHHAVLNEKEAAEEASSDSTGTVTKAASGKYVYLNQFHQPSHKFRDVAVYLSPTNYVPRRLVIQASTPILSSPDSLAKGDWIRTKVTGHVPIVLKMAEWALGPLVPGTRWWNKLDGAGRSLLVALPIQFLLAIPGLAAWELDDVKDSYTDFPGYHWEWPKYAINYLDMKPAAGGREGAVRGGGAGAGANATQLDVRVRSPRPRKVVRKTEDGGWEIVDGVKEAGLKYIFISYAWTQFADKGGDAAVRRMAEKITEAEGLQAYWLDKLCIEKERGGQQDYDVYTMCDIVRSADKVVVVLGDDRPESMTSWGRRMWTLPEGLLAPCDEIKFVHEDGQGGLVSKELHKIEMTATCWAELETSSSPDLSSSSSASMSSFDLTISPSTRNEATRILAEHFSGLLPLSRLELLPAVITALNTKARTEFTGSDLAYAVMGLLHYRIERDDGDTLFQNLAKLSLCNDGDDIVERMICLLPRPELQSSSKLAHQSSSFSISPAAKMGAGTAEKKPVADAPSLFTLLSTPDSFSTMLHHVKPLCEVVGVAAEDETVMIDNCRAIHIRWKDFPQAVVQRSVGIKRMIATFLVGAGLWWLTFGLQLVIYYIPFWADFAETANGDSKTYIAWLVCGFLFVGFLLSVFGPSSVRRLFGGIVLKSSPSLVAFEGVMKIRELEKIVFGNATGRLSYAPSATPLLKDNRHPRERRGVEPEWIDDPESISHLLPSPRHHLFTLVDMGELSVSIFSAERPPTVALLCGREGGMLRAVLCSWRFDNDCLYKETVVRMPSRVWGAASVKDWLKLSLKTQDQARREEMMRGER